MPGSTPFPFQYRMVIYPVMLMLAIWAAYWWDIQSTEAFYRWGILPRSVKGLRGIILSPFIHKDGFHLLHNSLPLLVLGIALFYFYNASAFKILIYGTLLSGLITWGLGRNSYHIGASGVIYMLFGFLCLKGLITKHYRLLALSFFVIFSYGSLVWYAAPIDETISWEGHLGGLISGVLFAFIFQKDIPAVPLHSIKKRPPTPAEEEFMKCFDEHGNFIPTSERLAKEQLAKEKLEQIAHAKNTRALSHTANFDIRIIYHPVKDKKRRG